MVEHHVQDDLNASFVAFLYQRLKFVGDCACRLPSGDGCAVPASEQGTCVWSIRRHTNTAESVGSTVRKQDQRPVSNCDGSCMSLDSGYELFVGLAETVHMYDHTVCVCVCLYNNNSRRVPIRNSFTV